MSRDYSKVGLYDHNIKGYEELTEGQKEKDITSIIRATGTGKGYIFLQLAYDNKDKNIYYFAPSNSIIEHIIEVIDNNPNLDMERDFPNLHLLTYQSLINMSDEELKNLNIDILVLDEFHHIGAPVWGARIKRIIETHKNMKVIGMSAYTVRDRGTEYERDVTLSGSDEIFADSIVSTYDLCDAMIDGVLPKPIYRSGYVYLERTAEYLEESIRKISSESKEYKELSKILLDIKRRLHEAPGVKDIFKQNIKKDGKYIYFCPRNGEEGRNDISSIQKEVRYWAYEMGLTDDDIEFYQTTSEMRIEGKKNRDAFYNDTDLNGKDSKHKLRIMFAIDQYNEGVHAPGIDGVILARSTSSDIVYFEQIGRALAVKKEKKQSPVIIDLANNIGFIKELENNLTQRVKEIREKGLGKKREIHLMDTKFDIAMLNEDLYQEIEYMLDRLTNSWEDKYELAKKYYNHNGNLLTPASYKTIDGTHYDENGIKLGGWIRQQRKDYSQGKLSETKIDLLNQIGIVWNVRNHQWSQMYELAKKYYNHHRNILIPDTFKTIDGTHYDENGINLGFWILRQRTMYAEGKLSKERHELLEQIGMIWNQLDDQWEKMYNSAKTYYEYHGNLDISIEFKTINGKDYNEKGKNLGSWISRQRYMYAEGKLSKEKHEMLEQIGMIWNVYDNQWDKMYALAKEYYNCYKNLKITSTYKTINGKDYDENGVALGKWLEAQRMKNLGGKLSKERIKLLDNIGMMWNVYDDQWDKMYALAKEYYNCYKNLKITSTYKTINGIDFDENGYSLGIWISTQRKMYQKGKMSKEKIKLLEQIGMIWKSYNNIWDTKYRLAKMYFEYNGNLQVPSRFKTTNGIDYDENGEALGNWIYIQKQKYKSGKMSIEQQRQLENIGMIFISPKKNEKTKSI